MGCVCTWRGMEWSISQCTGSLGYFYLAKLASLSLWKQGYFRPKIHLCVAFVSSLYFCQESVERSASLLIKAAVFEISPCSLFLRIKNFWEKRALQAWLRLVPCANGSSAGWTHWWEPGGLWAALWSEGCALPPAWKPAEPLGSADSWLLVWSLEWKS